MRYLPLTDTDRRDMLAVIGARSVDELFKDVPASARLAAKVAGLPDHQGELEVERAFQAYAAKNMIDAHVVPPEQPKLKLQAYADNFR